MTFLGHMVLEEGLQPDPRLLKSIREIQLPTSVTQVRSFLGLVGYYKRFIKGFSKIAALLNKLLEKNKPLVWTTERMKAYQELKELLLKEPVVAYLDFSMPFRLYTDTSNIGLGAILAQKQEGKEKIICFASRTLNKSEQNYSATKKDYLAMVSGIRNFRNYLIANHLKVYTDHYSLQWLRSMKNESTLLHRLAAQLEDYDFEILHRRGKSQGRVDALSRLPMDMVHFLGKEKMVLASAEDTFQVLERIHKDGHLGVKKALKLFRRRFEGIQEMALCQAVVSSCEGCQLGLDYKLRTMPLGKIESMSPWDVISIDIMGPFCCRKKSNRLFLSVPGPDSD